jgi:hypothetical protein
MDDTATGFGVLPAKPFLLLLHQQERALFMLLVQQVKTLNLILGIAFLWPSYRMIVEGIGIAKPKSAREGERAKQFPDPGY